MPRAPGEDRRDRGGRVPRVPPGDRVVNVPADRDDPAATVSFLDPAAHAREVHVLDVRRGDVLDAAYLPAVHGRIVAGDLLHVRPATLGRPFDAVGKVVLVT